MNEKTSIDFEFRQTGVRAARRGDGQKIQVTLRDEKSICKGAPWLGKGPSVIVVPSLNVSVAPRI